MEGILLVKIHVCTNSLEQPRPLFDAVAVSAIFSKETRDAPSWARAQGLSQAWEQQAELCIRFRVECFRLVFGRFLEGLGSSEQDKDIADDTPGRRREAVPDPRLSNQVPGALQALAQRKCSCA